MGSDVAAALPVFAKAATVAPSSASTRLNYAFCLMASVFGADAAQASVLPAAPSWAAPLDDAVAECRAALACDARCVLLRGALVWSACSACDSRRSASFAWGLHCLYGTKGCGRSFGVRGNALWS